MPGRMCYVSEKEEGVVVLYLEGCVMLVRKKRVYWCYAWKDVLDVSEKEEGVVVLYLEGCVMLVRKKRV